MSDVEVQASAIARLRNGSGQVAGGAFLVTSDLVVTCAHVVTAAVGGEPSDADPPNSPLSLEFPLFSKGDEKTREVDVVGWQPVRPDGSGDIAVLRLRRPAPPGI